MNFNLNIHISGSDPDMSEKDAEAYEQEVLAKARDFAESIRAGHSDQTGTFSSSHIGGENL